eukprot:CAMPEP_0178568890 /NCGR_PEP_ID=MMETSP0697-20121206/16176_1 /TAXON_ID=265572 /ORGANISM="Extubocellulus spinifer, Strain CCMP396" /LENGTH=227 /DNA_ID=CAMNT_0020203073 /DNA_START=137 /DNA_END=820 /DNA_ORIENTATION=-
MGRLFAKKDKKKSEALGSGDDDVEKKHGISEKGNLADQNEQLIGLNQKIIDQNQAILKQYQELLERSSSQYKQVFDQNVELRSKLDALIDEDGPEEEEGGVYTNASGSADWSVAEDAKNTAIVPVADSSSNYWHRMASAHMSGVAATATRMKEKTVAATEQAQHFLAPRCCHQCSDDDTPEAVPVNEPRVILYHEMVGTDGSKKSHESERDSVSTTAETDSDSSTTA